MSDAYEIDGVTLTPLGGGYYELKHSSLPEPGIEKVQGKDKADARAAEIAKAAKPDEGHMEQQAPLGQGADPAAEPAKPAEPSEAEKAKDDEIAALKAQLATSEADREKLTQAAAKVAGVVEEQKVDPAPAVVTGVVPRRYEGEMDAETKRLLKDMGLGVKRIILEENENIPPTGLFLGHNGRGYMVMPGGEVDVPEFLLNVLNDAVMAAPVVDPKTQKVLGYRNRLRYPYREVKD